MNKPYIILHMLTSIDGKVTGEYLSTDTAQKLCEEYYRINREYKASGYLCGRITMEGSFTGGKVPDLTPFKGQKNTFTDYVAGAFDYYAVAIDPHGRLAWYGSHINDYDEGYDNAHIIEVLTKAIPDGYEGYLRSLGVSYIFCGDDGIDVATLNDKLYNLFGIKKLMLEGGGKTDALFINGGCIDEISLVVAPLIDGSKEGVPLFDGKTNALAEYRLEKAQPLPDNGLWLNYKK